MRAGRFVAFHSLLVIVLLCSPSAYLQAQTGFDVRLDLNFFSAEKTIELYEGQLGSPSEIAGLRGSRLAMATTALLAQRPLTSEDLEKDLQAIKFRQTVGEDVFEMTHARDGVVAIKELLREIKRRNFSRRVSSTVGQLFPTDAHLATAIPVYFVAFGHHNIDAYVRRVVWDGDVPRFVGEGEGELTIVVNLSRGVEYGRTVDERFTGILSIVAHEVFHAAFGVYKDGSSTWREYYAHHGGFMDRLLDLTQNEGIAHYLTFEQRSGGYLPRDWDERVRSAFAEFNKNALLLVSGHITTQHAATLIRQSNTSSYWESYGAITGLFIARQIDQTLGREALAQSIARGPEDFFDKYAQLVAHDNNLPSLSERIVKK